MTFGVQSLVFSDQPINGKDIVFQFSFSDKNPFQGDQN